METFGSLHLQEDCLSFSYNPDTNLSKKYIIIFFPKFFLFHLEGKKENNIFTWTNFRVIWVLIAKISNITRKKKISKKTGVERENQFREKQKYWALSSWK